MNILYNTGDLNPIYSDISGTIYRRMLWLTNPIIHANSGTVRTFYAHRFAKASDSANRRILPSDTAMPMPICGLDQRYNDFYDFYDKRLLQRFDFDDERLAALL